MILKLGEARLLTLITSQDAIGELESALRRKAPQHLGTLAVILDRARFEITSSPDERSTNKVLKLTGHRGDARIMAAALASAPDFFVTLDREHFLDNHALIEAAPFLIGTPGDLLAWYREKIEEF
jgi:hypothetical protein